MRVAAEAQAAARRRGPAGLGRRRGLAPGVVGIVAARLKETFNRPAVVIGFHGGEGKGSARSVSGVDLGAGIARLMREGLILRGGGHRMAAGLTLTPEQVEPAMARLARAHRRAGGGAGDAGAPARRRAGARRRDAGARRADRRGGPLRRRVARAAAGGGRGTHRRRAADRGEPPGAGAGRRLAVGSTRSPSAPSRAPSAPSCSARAAAGAPRRAARARRVAGARAGEAARRGRGAGADEQLDVRRRDGRSRPASRPRTSSALAARRLHTPRPRPSSIG